MSYEFFCFFYTGKGYFADVGYLLTEGTDFDVLTLDATEYLVEDARYHVDFSVFEQRAIAAIAHAGSFYTAHRRASLVISDKPCPLMSDLTPF